MANHIKGTQIIFDRNLVASNLKQARERLNLSQTDLAKRTGLNPSAISHFETGRRTPSLENFYLLVFCLNVSAGELLGAK